MTGISFSAQPSTHANPSFLSLMLYEQNGLWYRAVKPNDIAPTLSAIVSAKSPSGANGDILEEVLEDVR